MKSILEKMLALLARAILRKYRPRIVGITGSVGKSSTKEAVTKVLAERFKVRGSLKNYNNELGVPLSIVGALSGGRSPFQWLGILWRAVSMLVRCVDYPAVLVLEMGADHPGDIAYLTLLAPPEVGVVTAVASVHTEFFKNVGGVLREKRTLVEVLPQKGFAVLNYDDELVRDMARATRARVITYGFLEGADVRALEFTLHYERGVRPEDAGILFKLAYGGSVAPVRIPGVLGKQHVYAALAGAAVGCAFDMNLVEIARGIARYEPPRGRMCILAGIKRTTVIDDTYNASPRSTHEALRTLRVIEIPESARRIAVLGDMKELGAYEADGHREVGALAAELGVDLLITVGELARGIAHGAREKGMINDHIFEFVARDEAGRFVQDRMREGDVVLVKGSQAARMENIVKEIMAEPQHAAELLVRQDKNWLS